MNFVPAKCPNCSGDLQVPDDRTAVKCMYCGGEIVVAQAIASAAPSFANLLHLAKAAHSAGNEAEAISYCNRALELEPRSHAAWFLKGESAGWSSTLANVRLSEAAACFRNALENAPAAERSQLDAHASASMRRLCEACLTLAADHYARFSELDDSLGGLADRCLQVETNIDVTDCDSAAAHRTMIELYDGQLARVREESFWHFIGQRRDRHTSRLSELDPSYTPPPTISSVLEARSAARAEKAARAEEAWTRVRELPPEVIAERLAAVKSRALAEVRSREMPTATGTNATMKESGCLVLAGAIGFLLGIAGLVSR